MFWRCFRTFVYGNIECVSLPLNFKLIQMPDKNPCISSSVILSIFRLQSILAMILKIFDVGCSVWHLLQDIWHILPNQNWLTFSVCFVVFVITVQTFTDSLVLYECRVIGAEQPFIAHSTEHCPSIWKGISYHRPTGSHYRVLFRRMAYPKLLCVC